MNYSEYKTDLHHIHQSEVYGVNVFKMAGWLTFIRDKKNKWALLRRLEQQTLERFVDHVIETNQEHRYPWVWAIKGYFEGLVLGLLPWSFAMKLMASETEHFAVVWLRLKNHADKSEGAFFDYIYAHERAIQAFARFELAQQDNSCKPLRGLLDD